MPLFASVNIVFPDTSITGGDTLIYPVFAQNVQPEDSIYGGQFWISISEPLLTPVRVAQGDITGDWGIAFAFDSTTLKLNIVMWGGTALRSDGVLFYINFLVSNPRTTTTTYIVVDSCYLIDEISNPIQLTVDTGIVVVTPVGIEESVLQNPLRVLFHEDGLMIINSRPVEVSIFSVDGRLERREMIDGRKRLTHFGQGVHFIVIKDRGREIFRKKFVIFR